MLSDLLLQLIFGHDVPNPYMRAFTTWPVVPYVGILTLALLGLVSYTMVMGKHEFRTRRTYQKITVRYPYHNSRYLVSRSSLNHDISEFCVFFSVLFS